MAETVSYIIQLRDRMSGNLGNINRNLGKFQKNLDKSKRRIKSLETAQKKLGAMARTATLGFTLPIIAGLGLIAKEAIDAQETITKFATVFESVEKSAEGMAANLTKNFGMSKIQAKEVLASTGDLLIGFGFAESSALNLSNQVAELAVDLSSFNNVSEERAVGALKSALVGEREALKSLGIVISEELVKQQIAINVSNGLRFATLQQAKSQATLQIAIKQSGKTIGDYARTSGGAANMLKRATNRFKDLRIEIGTLLVPSIVKLLERTLVMLEKTAKWVRNNKELTKTLIKVALVIAALGPILTVISNLVGAFVLLTKAVKILAIIFGNTFIAIGIGFLTFFDLFINHSDLIRFHINEWIKGIKIIFGFLGKIPGLSSLTSDVIRFHINEWLKGIKMIFGFLGKIPGLSSLTKGKVVFEEIITVRDPQAAPKVGPLRTSENSVNVGGKIVIQAPPNVVTSMDFFNKDVGKNLVTVGG